MWGLSETGFNSQPPTHLTVPKKLQIISLFPLDYILHPLLGINKAHLYKVENSPGSSFCSVAAHSTIFHTTGAHCCPVSIYQLFPLLQLVVGPSSVIKSLNHSLYMLIPNYLKGWKKKKKNQTSSAWSVLRAFVSYGWKQTPSQPNLCALENHPCIPWAAYAAAAPPPAARSPPGSCQRPYSLRSPTNRNHPPAPGWLRLSPLRCLLGCDPCLLSWPCFIGCSNRSWNGY